MFDPDEQPEVYSDCRDTLEGVVDEIIVPSPGDTVSIPEAAGETC